MKENSKPSANQVVEAMHSIGIGIPGSLSTPLQWWIQNPATRYLVEQIINLGPKIVQEMISNFEPKPTDVIYFKSKLLGPEYLQDFLKKSMPKQTTGYCFPHCATNQFIEALNELGVNVQLPRLNFFKLGFAEELPTEAKETTFPEKEILKRIKKEDSTKIQIDDIAKYCESHNYKIASLEEILDLFLDIAIRAILQNKKPTVEIIHSLYPDNNGEPFFIVCRNNILGNNIESKRPIIIKIESAKPVISIESWPVKEFSEGEKNKQIGIHGKKVGIIPA